MVDRGARNLLGRHVRRGPHHDARLRLVERRHGLLVSGETAHLLGEAEVEHLHPPVARDHDVGGLQVAMDDPLAVRVRDRVRHGHRNVHGSRDGPPFGWNGRRQRLPIDKLHGQEVNALAFLYGIERHHIGVIECGDRARFAMEPGQPVAIGRQVRGQDLQGDIAAEPGVFGPIDLTHSAGADRGKDFVGSETIADGHAGGSGGHASPRNPPPPQYFTS